MIRLVIADDHPVVREGLKYVVGQNRDIQLVGEAEDGDTTLEICRTAAVDVLLLDVSMPGPGVVDLIHRLKSASPRLRTLVLSVHPERHYARRVLRAGADGYLTKNHSPSTLAAAIRRVYGGHKYITSSLAEDLVLDLAGGGENGAHEALSTREHQVFLRLGAGARVNEIAEQLGLSPKTVRTYRSRILEKLNLTSTAALIFYAVQNGLVTQAESPQGPGPVAGTGTAYDQRRDGLGPTAGGETSSHTPASVTQRTRSSRRA